MLRDRLSKLGDSGLENTIGSDSIAAIELGSLSGPSGGGVGN